LVECGQYEENVSYWTRSPSSVVFPVHSAEACEAQCVAKQDIQSCGAWTWGKQRHVFGLTDVCLLQALPEADEVKRRQKDGVISGVLSQRNCTIRGVPAELDTTVTTLTTVTSRTRFSFTTTSRTLTSTEAPTLTSTTTTIETTVTTTEAMDNSCSSPQDDIDFVTNHALRTLYPIKSADDCAKQCFLDNECGAWTWGKARNVDGATDVCFLKRLAPPARPVLHRKVGMVSGVSCKTWPEGIPSRPDNSGMYCYSLMMPESYEVELIKMQYDRHISIFDCDEWEVYSNKIIEIVEGVNSGLVDSDLKCGTGGEFGTALNKEIFEAVWNSVVRDKRFLEHPWTVKADPDCVFFPAKLQVVLQDYPKDPEVGQYLNNCKFGMHGPLEVFSRNAASTWHNGVQECETYFTEQCSGDCLWGEDMFIDQCLLRVLHADRVDAFDYMIEDHCDPPDDWESCRNASVAAFHPFKDEDSYLDCWNNAEEASGQAGAP
jgi:hypothetical protein